MRLEKLLDGYAHSGANHRLNLEITGISHDSRYVHPGEIFVCLRGLRTDGHKYAAAAVENGAAAVVAERELLLPVPVVLVKDTRDALSYLSARFFDHPSGKLNVIGVTGTNGKTTTTHFIQAAYRAAGKPCAVIGTIGIRVDEHYHPGMLTTPEAFDLQRTLSHLRQKDIVNVAMEVSSHSLAWKRVEHVSFETAVFTNLTQDHLDFHGSMEEYFMAKAHLFELLNRDKNRPRAVVNLDDPYGRKLVSMLDMPCFTYGLSADADVRGRIVRANHSSTLLSVNHNQREFAMEIKLPGSFNAYNALAATAAVLADGIAEECVVEGIESLRYVPGRMETVNLRQDFQIVIDFAHTPDGLEKVLQTLSETPHRRLITVFGCAGDRDRVKRPLMGRIAEAYSDVVVVTSDNPASEDPEDIIAEIVGGMSGQPLVFPEREEAVKYALTIAGSGDIVLLAGKGHETYQLIGEKKVPYSDRLAVESFFIS